MPQKTVIEKVRDSEREQYSVPAVASLLGKSTRQVYNYICDNKLAAKRNGPRGTKIHKTDLIEFLEGGWLGA